MLTTVETAPRFAVIVLLLTPVMFAVTPAQALGQLGSFTQPQPLKNLNIVVLTTDARPLAEGYCVIGAERR